MRVPLNGAIIAIALAATVGGCSADDNDVAAESAAVPATDPGPVHVHGLGINPADGALFVATHTGLFRAGPGEPTATRVGDLYQDTMGFTVVGPDRFLGSGHPDLRTDQPPYLGLIVSDDAGQSWQPVSLHGDADFHVLEAAGERVVGYGSDFESRRQQLLVSDDAGRTWEERRPPMPLLDLAVSPTDADLWVAGGRGLSRTADAGRTWTKLAGAGGLLAWEGDTLFRVDLRGEVAVSSDAGTSWRRVGDIGAEPAALEADAGALYVAQHDGVIKQSRDGGRSWTVRSRPQETTTGG